MRKYIAALFLCIISTISSYAQDAKYKASVWHTGGNKETTYTNVIDSITFSEKLGGKYTQNIWINGCSYENDVNEIDSVSIKGSIIEYTIIEEPIEDIVGGVVTADGAYCLLQKNDSIEGFACYIGENENDQIPMIINIDTIGVIRSIACDETIYDFIYHEKSFDIVISTNGETQKVSNVSYDILSDKLPARARKRVGGTSNGVDGWAEMANKISAVAAIGEIASNPHALSSKIGVLTLIGGMSDNKYVRRSAIAVDLVMSLKNGGVFGVIWGLYQAGREAEHEWWFGDVKVTTLGAEHITDSKYRVYCSITNMSTISDPDNMEAQLMMTLEKRPPILGQRLTGNIKSLTKDYVQEDGAYYFEFDGLELGQQYCFQPRLYRTWIDRVAENKMTVSDIFTYGGAIPGGGGIATVHRRSDIYMYGEIGTFATNSTMIESIETKKTEATRGHVNFTIEVKGLGYAAPNNDKETLGQGSLGVYIKNGDEYKHYPATFINGNNFTAELSFEESINTMDNVDYSTFISTKKIEIGSYVMAYRQSGQYDYESVYYYSEPQEYELVYDEKPSLTFTSASLGGTKTYTYDNGESYYCSTEINATYVAKGTFWVNTTDLVVIQGLALDHVGYWEVLNDGEYPFSTYYSYPYGGDNLSAFKFDMVISEDNRISSTNAIQVSGYPYVTNISIVSNNAQTKAKLPYVPVKSNGDDASKAKYVFSLKK